MMLDEGDLIREINQEIPDNSVEVDLTSSEEPEDGTIYEDDQSDSLLDRAMDLLESFEAFMYLHVDEKILSALPQTTKWELMKLEKQIQDFNTQFNRR
jgi:hypothetical protein